MKGRKEEGQIDYRPIAKALNFINTDLRISADTFAEVHRKGLEAPTKLRRYWFFGLTVPFLLPFRSFQVNPVPVLLPLCLLPVDPVPFFI